MLENIKGSKSKSMSKRILAITLYAAVVSLSGCAYTNSRIARVVQNKTLIQSDINIYPGSSGSPLLYKSGTVVGIAVSQFAVNKTPQGISFFIPIDDALKSLEVI